jgi:type II secretory pathway component PulM
VKQWFLRFTPREQLALLLLATAVGAYLLAMLAIVPLERARQQLLSTNVATAEMLQRVDGLASAILAQREAGGAPVRSRNLTGLLNSGAEAAGLRIARLQPNNRGAVQLRMEGVSFASLLRWLHSLEDGEGLIVEELSVSQSGAPGIVSASVRVSQPL